MKATIQLKVNENTPIQLFIETDVRTIRAVQDALKEAKNSYYGPLRLFTEIINQAAQHYHKDVDTAQILEPK